MSAIGVFSVKGSPGATTLALALAGHGYGQGAVLIEADTAGGDLALRFGIAQHPGLAQLAARARHTGRRDVLDGLVRTAVVDGAGPVDLLAAPVEPAAALAAATALAATPHALNAAAKARPLVLDLGRLDANSPGLGLLTCCDAAVLVVRGDAVSLGHARETGWITGLPVRRAGFVLVDTGPYRADDAADVLALPCLATIPVRRGSLRGRRGARTVATLWTDLAVPVAASMPARELVEVKG